MTKINQPTLKNNWLREEIDSLQTLKTDERKVATFGEWQAETYEDKMLVNAVIQSIQDHYKNKLNE